MSLEKPLGCLAEATVETRRRARAYIERDPEQRVTVTVSCQECPFGSQEFSQKGRDVQAITKRLEANAGHWLGAVCNAPIEHSERAMEDAQRRTGPHHTLRSQKTPEPGIQESHYQPPKYEDEFIPTADEVDEINRALNEIAGIMGYDRPRY